MSSKMLLSEQRMEEIIDAGTIDECTELQKKQVMAFAFGEKFIASDEKGSLKEYANDK